MDGMGEPCEAVGGVDDAHRSVTPTQCRRSVPRSLALRRGEMWILRIRGRWSERTRGRMRIRAGENETGET